MKLAVPSTVRPWHAEPEQTTIPTFISHVDLPTDRAASRFVESRSGLAASARQVVSASRNTTQSASSALN